MIAFFSFVCVDKVRVGLSRSHRAYLAKVVKQTKKKKKEKRKEKKKSVGKTLSKENISILQSVEIWARYLWRLVLLLLIVLAHHFTAFVVFVGVFGGVVHPLVEVQA
eukprot:TRINITY_DN3541_c0_g2_i11.p3 TRINITY_DN3541_c0_g2~~TRINITY_DN3541_c0_g2_i11.p3  ORF type:complete len:107 (-),score=2.40 TRINITY_DN3541_c0_g2_i11:115-435(-)